MPAKSTELAEVAAPAPVEAGSVGTAGENVPDATDRPADGASREPAAPEMTETAPAPTPAASPQPGDRSAPSSSTEPPAPAAPVETTAATRASFSNLDEAAIRQTLGRYVQAYDRLDAKAAASIWPSVDQQALARSFSALRLQKVGLDRCEVTPSDASTATALCIGSVQYVRNTGSPAPQVEKRRWEFRLKKQDAIWQIANVSRLTPGGPAPSGPAVAGAPTEVIAAGASSSAGPDEIAIRKTLGRYARSYDRLDVKGAAEVWPTVDQSSLARAFSELRLQRVGFDRCDVAMLDASTANASCVGSVQYVRSAGNGAPQLERRKWDFRLAKQGADWRIVNVARQTTAREE
jgi:hypothetical protein